MNNFLLRCNGTFLNLETPKIMGVLNITEDSFYESSRVLENDAITERMGLMVEEGADLLDLGAMSSRPGSEPIDASLEEDRIANAVSLARKWFPNIPISVDTYRAKVAKAALHAGASILNDISAGREDPELLNLIAEKKPTYVLMHMQGMPKNMQINPTYENLISDLSQFFSERLHTLSEMGVSDILLDPGFGFGKTLSQNYEILKNLKVFSTVFNLPLLVGVSRKKMIQEVCGKNANEVLPGSIAAIVLAMEQGASILRVHDVAATQQARAVFLAYQNTAR
jgi:dihydropteroate synthase